MVTRARTLALVLLGLVAAGAPTAAVPPCSFSRCGPAS
jgi:hypothetical protein